MVFQASKIMLSQEKNKNFFFNFIIMILQMVRNECVKFGGHVYVQVSYKWKYKLTPKIPSVFLPISTVSDLLGGIHFSIKKSMRTIGS
jgi:hypothetical protein